MPSWNDVVPPLTHRLAAAGFDLWSWTLVGRYNDAVPDEYRMPDLGRAETPCLVFGNSRALWATLQTARSESEDLAAHPHPVDTYTAQVFASEVASLGVAYELRLAAEPPPRRIAMQKLAHLAGLAHLGPAHLTVHPEFGPWHGLRAALVLDLTPPPLPAPAPDPCTPCDRPCLAAMQVALADTGAGPSWQRWLAVRDACPEGRAARYGENQIRYHYSHDRAALKADT